MNKLDILYDSFMDGMRLIIKHHHSWDEDIWLAADAEINHLEKNEDGTLTFYVDEDVRYATCKCKDIEGVRKHYIDHLRLCDPDVGESVCCFSNGGIINLGTIESGQLFKLTPLEIASDD